MIFSGSGSRLATFASLLLLPGFASSLSFGQAPAGPGETTSSPPAARSAPPLMGQGSLLFRSPVSGRYEITPLKHTDVEIDVRGLVASATVTQRYENTTGEALEGIYVFPLPAKAAVYDMEIRVGGRVIRSVVKERAEAKRTYEKAKSEGRRAALLEEERPNVFTTSVANIMPNDVIDVRLRYVEPLEWDGGTVRLTFPMVVGPRFIPGDPVGREGAGTSPDTGAVPDASRITPPVRHPDSRPGHDLSLRVSLDIGVPLAEVTSPTHATEAAARPDGSHEVRLAAASVLPNRDFVLVARRAEEKTLRTAVFLSKGPDETHFMLVAFPPSAAPAGERPPIEMLFLIDISGSMAGTSIRQAREALIQGLDRLLPSDRFNIVAFDNSFLGFRKDPVPATVPEVEAGRAFARGLEARGGTVMLPALEHVMAMPASPGFLRYIVLLTDGDLGNEEQIFASLKRNLGDARLFTVAIGSAPNHFLATKMAAFGRGAFSHIADVSEIRQQMGRLLDTIESPVLAGLALAWEGAGVSDVSPERPPDLFLARPLVVYGRVSNVSAGAHVRLSGRAGPAPHESLHDLNAASARFHPGITTLWARAKVEDLTDRWRLSSEGDARDAARAGIVGHATRYNLVTRFTSLVAVEEIIVNPSGSPRPAVVPTELPHGWELDKVFGGNPRTGTADIFLELAGVALLGAGLMLLTLTRRLRAVTAP